ncbi:MAG: bifunctional riboflavin kinase/FAD synthetase [Thermodesulfobacteriales bacterium]|jgi:riboflavin kinase/FMN adenylyltransferase|nr:MAG: bifunctional riboflavin kinase/FAD synthetase [Thermodesulfobacteriales bacterium]
MKVIFDPEEPIQNSTSATIGNFDGVHIGHKKILSAVKKEAKQQGLSSCVITFHPHPQKVLQNIDIPLLVPIRERLKLLEDQGIDVVACYTFTKEIAKISAQDFVTDILVGKLNLKHLIVGPDFSFGRKREGNLSLLNKMGAEYGFDTEVVETALYEGEIVSSTSIRNLVREGNLLKARNFLGYNFYIEGQVKEGERRGRQIGFPTANLDTDWDILPKVGVYATLANVDGTKHQSITNIGYRPTFGHNGLLIETHIFDFDEDIYKKRIKVEFVDRVRDEQKFNGPEALVEQIKRDVERVKEILSSN